MQNRIAPPLALLLLLLGTTACDSTTAVEKELEPDGDDIVVAGKVTNRSGAAIPADARVLVVWMVSALDPDYAYVLGEGELTDGGTRFRVSLDAPPPDAALNYGRLGVGLVVLTTDQDVGTGDDLMPDGAILGVAGWYGVIYVREPMLSSIGWVTTFPAGYSVGRGVESTSADFDSFERVAPDAMELIVDDLNDIAIVDWT
jgi:hypothetical protein